MKSVDASRGAGRVCPADYRYSASTFARTPDVSAFTLYVVGGLYGNCAALNAIEVMLEGESDHTEVVYNGDFHWLDASPERFSIIDRGVLARHALRGNVETELARGIDAGIGCGCAYPDSIDNQTVERSNRILARLRECAGSLPKARERLGRLPMTLNAAVGPLRVGIVHGDAESLAGWGFAREALDSPSSLPWLERVRAASGVDVFACSHTGQAVLRHFSLDAGHLTIANNGAAGMPNFPKAVYGVITRIGLRPSPHRSLYGLEHNGVFIEALPVLYDQRRWLSEFLDDWPPGTDAYESYFSRITTGPCTVPDDSRLEHTP